MKLFQPRHHLLLLTSALFFIAAFFTLKKTLDVHMNQTTYVVSFARIFMFCAVYLSILWLLYTYTYSMIGSKRIYHFHIVLTILLFVIIIITALWSNQWIEAYSGQDFIKKATLSAETGQFVVGALLTLVTAQLLVPINLIMGWFKNRKRKASSR